MMVGFLNGAAPESGRSGTAPYLDLISTSWLRHVEPTTDNLAKRKREK